MAPGKKKWDEDKVKDLLMSIRVGLNGFDPITKEMWDRITRVMQMTGHIDATWTGLSQRWSKNLQKEFQTRYPDAVAVADGAIAPSSARVVGAAAAPTAPAPAITTPTVAAPATPIIRIRVPKRQRQVVEEEEEEEVDEDEEAADEEEPVQAPVSKKGRAAKKQKTDQ